MKRKINSNLLLLMHFILENNTLNDIIFICGTLIIVEFNFIQKDRHLIEKALSCLNFNGKAITVIIN